MPKEIITNGSFQRGDAWVQVGWRRDQGVQIGVEQEAQAGAETQTFVHLARDDINRLIRTLRKARDAAYGSDA